MSFRLNLVLLNFFVITVVLVHLEKNGLPCISNAKSFVHLLQLGPIFSHLKFSAPLFLFFDLYVFCTFMIYAYGKKFFQVTHSVCVCVCVCVCLCVCVCACVCVCVCVCVCANGNGTYSTNFPVADNKSIFLHLAYWS